MSLYVLRGIMNPFQLFLQRCHIDTQRGDVIIPAASLDMLRDQSGIHFHQQKIITVLYGDRMVCGIPVKMP